ncbi:MAG: flagellin FliC [Magnetococcales bacterium]|nr:flagellin FliC [Magnetococcales bacterium]
MAISINTNMASIMAYKGLQSTSNALATSMQRLATGLKINSAKDDAAGLAVATRMTSQIRGANQAIQNVNTGLSLVDVAIGALDETLNSIQSIRDLAVQAADITATNDLTALNNTVTELKTTIDNIATSTKFNNITLLDGTFSAETFQVGPGSTDTLSVTVTGTSQTSANLGLSAGDVLSAANATTMIGLADTAITSVNQLLASLSGYSSRFETIASTLSTSVTGMTASRSAIMDADVAVESSNLTKNSIIQQAGVAVLSQANLQPKLFLKLFE